MNFLQKTTRKVLSPAGQKRILLVLCALCSWSCALLPEATVTFRKEAYQSALRAC